VSLKVGSRGVLQRDGGGGAGPGPCAVPGREPESQEGIPEGVGLPLSFLY